MMSPVESVINLLTPPTCIICSSEGDELCSGCFVSTFPASSSRCYICNKLMVDAAVCTACQSRSRLRRVWSLDTYEGELKEMIWSIKYRRSRSTARLLARYLADRLPYLPEGTFVVPVPTATRRVRVRGFDQAVILAKTLATYRKLPYATLFWRTSQVEQIGKRRNERMKQMEGSLMLTHKNTIKGKNILLIDDVLTTGATLETAAALLRDAGAKHVDAAVVARRLLH
jgi:ComF family protein